MNVVFMILLFIAPGLAINTYKKYFNRYEGSSEERNVYEQMFSAVAHSGCVTAWTVAFVCSGTYALRHLFRINCMFPETITGLAGWLDSYIHLLIYIGVSAAVTVAWYNVYERKLGRYIKNMRADKNERERGLLPYDGENDLTVWENIFMTKESNEKRKIVSIYKDGSYITSGEVGGWNTGKAEKRELRLLNTRTIEEVLEHDKMKPVELRLLYNVDFEYVDTETGLMIRFYDPEKIEEHWDEL